MKKFCCKSKKIVKNSAENVHFKRGLALAVAASVAFTSADFTSMAVADVADIDPIEIARFEGLDADVAYQQLNAGASESDIVFPNTLRAIKSENDGAVIEDENGEISENPEEPQDNGSEDSEPASNAVELQFDDVTTEEPEDEITVEEENDIARLIGGFFNNIFGGFSTTAFAADSNEINVTGVEWTLSEELSDRAEFTTEEEWLRFVYVPEIPSCYVTDAEIPMITVDVIGGEVLGEVRPEETEEEEILVEDAESDAASEGSEDADFEAEEDAETEALPDTTNAYKYVGKSGDKTNIVDVLKNTTVDGAAMPILDDTTAANVEIVSASVGDINDYLGIIESQTGTTKEFTLEIKTAFAEEKELTVVIKEKTDSSSSSSSDASSAASSGSSEEAKEKTYKIKVTADASDDAKIDVSFVDTARYVYNKKAQTLKDTDVVVKVGDPAVPLTLGTDYEIVQPAADVINAGTYNFTVKFKGNYATTYAQKTAEWTIKPVKVKLTADNKASVVNGTQQSASYSLTCIEDADKANFKENDQIPGITATFTSTNLNLSTSGTYDIVNSYTGKDTNYDIQDDQNVNAAKYYVVGPVKLQMVVDTKKYDSGVTIQKGTKYYATFANVNTSGLRVSSLTATYVYKNAAGEIVAAVSGTKTDGLPTDLGKYTVYAIYKVSKIVLPDKTVVPVISNDEVTTDPISYEIVENKKEITSSNVTLNKTSFTYNGKYQGPTVTVKYDGVKLTKGTDYEVTGDEEMDADAYELTVTGKGEYSGSVDKTWKISPADISKATLPSSTKVSYSYTGNEISHTVPSTISLSGVGTLKIDEDYEVDSSSTTSATKAGTYTVKLKACDDNLTGTKSYTWKITSSSSSTTGTASSSVSFSNPNNVSSGITNVASSGLASYASSKKQSGKKITFTLNVKPISKSTLGSTELNAIAEYGDEAAVSTDSLDVTVHRTVKDADGNTESDEDVSDLGSAIDVIAYVGTTNSAKTINVIREHNGEVKKFSKVSSRPSSSYTDGTYYVDKTNGKVYIYSRYFSRFTLIYTDTDTVVKSTKTSSSKSSSSSEDGDALGARAPQTGDNLPVVWVWLIVLLAGVGLVGFSAFELRRFKRGDFKKKR